MIKKESVQAEMELRQRRAHCSVIASSARLHRHYMHYLQKHQGFVALGRHCNHNKRMNKSINELNINYGIQDKPIPTLNTSAIPSNTSQYPLNAHADPPQYRATIQRYLTVLFSVLPRQVISIGMSTCAELVSTTGNRTLMSQATSLAPAAQPS
jgi:hypothetical protein